MLIFRRTNFLWEDVALLHVFHYDTWASESRPERVNARFINVYPELVPKLLFRYKGTCNLFILLRDSHVLNVIEQKL